jgi:hypothetical protein
MSLLDDAIAENRTPGGTCTTRTWLATLSKKEQAEVAEAMDAPQTVVQHAALTRAIKKRWPDAPGHDPLVRHRKRECCCGSAG